MAARSLPIWIVTAKDKQMTNDQEKRRSRDRWRRERVIRALSAREGLPVPAERIREIVGVRFNAVMDELDRVGAREGFIIERHRYQVRGAEELWLVFRRFQRSLFSEAC